MVAVGFGAAVAWNGQGVYITRSAVTYATKFREVGDADNAADENGTATGTSDGVEQRAIGTFNGLFNGMDSACPAALYLCPMQLFDASSSESVWWCSRYISGWIDMWGTLNCADSKPWPFAMGVRCCGRSRESAVAAHATLFLAVCTGGVWRSFHGFSST